MMDRAQSLRRFFFIGLVVFLGSVLGITGYTLWRSHTEAIANGLEVSSMQVRGFESFLTQSLHAADIAAVNAIPQGEGLTDLRAMGRSFTTTLRHAPFLRSMSLADDKGRIVASSNPANVDKTIRTEGFLPQTQDSVGMLRMGRPWAGRDFADGSASTDSAPTAPDAQSFIPLSHALLVDTRPYTLLLAFNTDYFLNHVAQTLETEEGSVEVLRYDGTLLLDTQAGVPLGKLRAATLQTLRLSDGERGGFEHYDATLGHVLTAYRASHLYPFVVLVHRQRDAALQAWRSEAQTLLAIVFSALLVIGVLALTIYRRQLQFVRQQAEADRLRRVNASVFEASTDAIIITDRHANIISVNPAFTRITGYSAEEVIGQNPRMLKSGLHDAAFYRHLWNMLLDSGVWHGEVTNRRKDGVLIDCQATITATHDSRGRLQHLIGDISDISERKQAQKQISELNRDFVAFLENTSDFIYFKDENSRFRFCSQPLAQITGHRHWRDLIGKNDWEVFPPDMAKVYWDEEIPIFRDAQALKNKVDPYLDASGAPGWVSTNKWPVLDANGTVVGLFGISRDITARISAEKNLKLAASVFANSREAIMITATDGAIVDVNEAFTRITGYSRDDVIGQNPRILSSGRQGKEHYAAMWRSLLEKGHWYGEIWNRRKNGEVYAEMQTISSVKDESGNAQHFVSLFSDITPIKEHQMQLEHIAHFDALTGLPNRVLLADRLRQGMTQSLRRRQLLAVAFLDLDGFKSINDTHGHEAGDHLLIVLATRMRQALREVDTLARIGGDEFVAVLADLSEISTTVPMISRLLAAAAHPVQFGDATLRVSASLGVTFYPQTEDVDADQLLRQADQAMYQAKLAGKNRYHIFDAEQDRSVRGHHESLDRIRLALSHGEFLLYYQPKVNMRSGQVIGAEALIRWQHPEQGLWEPAAFLPAIEDHPLAVEIGEWVIGEAMRQMALWRTQGLDLPVSVNVGARQLQSSNFLQHLRSTLDTYPAIAPSCLELEILETSALEDVAAASEVIEACRQMGVHFALDDFGTGYSSLTYLKRLPATLLKIDQSFVRDMLEDPEDLAILDGVIGLANAFGRDVIAEGVETPAHGSMLLQLGCDLAQGYGIAWPMAADLIPAWVRDWKPVADWGQQTPMQRDDVPLLFVIVESRAWLKAMQSYCKGERETQPPALNIAHSRFVKWLNTGGLERHGARTFYESLEALHRQAHTLATELRALKPQQNIAKMLAKLDTFRLVSAQLHDQIHRLIQGTPGAPYQGAQS